MHIAPPKGHYILTNPDEVLTKDCWAANESSNHHWFRPSLHPGYPNTVAYWAKEPNASLIAKPFPSIPGYRVLDDGEVLCEGDETISGYPKSPRKFDVGWSSFGGTVHYPSNETTDRAGVNFKYNDNLLFIRPLPVKPVEQEFWTITSKNTTHCNDLSTRFTSEDDAVQAATYRIEKGEANDGVYIMKSVKLVRPVKPVTDVVVEEV